MGNDQRKILVTGGAGFIGSHVVEALLKEGHHVWALDDLSGGFKENVSPKAHFVEASILNNDLIEELFSKNKFDVVFHLAAYAAEGLSHFIKRFNYENNLMGSVNLINQSILHKVKCFVFTSSIAVYGKNKSPLTESMIPQPEDPYGIAKLAVEQELKVSHEMFGLPYIIFRPHNVYGEKQNIGDRYRNVVGIFMNQLMQQKPMTIFGDGNQKRAFTYIGDIAPLMARSIETPKAYNHIFNIGADHPYTVNQLAKEVAHAFNMDAKIQYLDFRKEAYEAYSDHSKVQEIFGTTSKTSLTEGLSKMVSWAKIHGARSSKKFSHIEVPINLPPSWAE